MSNRLKQSAIQEGASQLFLDTAEKNRLNVVTSNLGLTRPYFGSGDAEWRAAAKQIALKPKLILTLFERIIEICLGPKFSRVSALAADAEIGDEIITVEDATQFVQVGKVILDSGTGTEEEVTFDFVDIPNNEIWLSTPLTLPHTASTLASSRLVTSVDIGATTIVLNDTSLFPTDYPYAILIDENSFDEEILIVSDNDTGTNTLTVSATTKAHKGYIASFYKTDLGADTIAGRTFLQFADEKTLNFPPTGFVRINKGTGTEEIVEYSENDGENDALLLTAPLEFDHFADEPVEELTPGASVKTASVLQEGAHWDIFETENHKVKIFVPVELQVLRLTDASWLHGEVPDPVSTTLSDDVTSDDLVLPLTSTSGLPATGMLQIDGDQVVFYTFLDEDASEVTLDRALGNNYSSGTSVTLYTFAYSGTNLEDGNQRDEDGDFQFYRFPGPYAYKIDDQGPSNTKTTLDAILPPETRVVVDQKVGRTSLEVEDLSLWSPMDSVEVGVGSGFAEMVDFVGINLKIEALTTTNTGGIAGSTSLDVVDTTSFPSSDGTNPAGFRIIINRGNGTEEIIRVDQVDPTTFTFEDPLVFSHIGGEAVELLADVLSVSKLTKHHAGIKYNPTKLGHRVQPLITEIPLDDASDFPTDGGKIWINFGKEIINSRSRISIIGAPDTYVLEDTSGFPTNNYPYQIVIGKGLYVEERINVVDNDTGTNTLTLESSTINTHIPSEIVEFTSGDPETIDYNSISGDTLELSEAITPTSKHLIGETVTLSTLTSTPRSDGYSYDFKMPPDPTACFRTLIEFVKAAGIEIIYLTQR